MLHEQTTDARAIDQADHHQVQPGRPGWQSQLPARLAAGASVHDIGMFIVHRIPASEREEAWSYLHQHRGNGYVQAVIAATTQDAEQAPQTKPTAIDPAALLASIKAGETSIEIGGDDKFKAKILGVLASLASQPAGLSLLDQVARSPFPARIAPLQGDMRAQYMTTTPDDFDARLLKDDGTPGAGTGTTILINAALPETFALDAQGNKIPSPAFINIGHELIHTLHNSQGKNARNQAGTHAGHDNREEENTIEGTELSENTLRKEHGLPLRGSHGGGPMENARTRLVDAYKQQESAMMRDLYETSPGPEALERMQGFITSAEQVLELDELWEVDPHRVAEYRDQAKRFVNYPVHRAAVWKQAGPQITAGYDQLRTTLAASQKEDAEFYTMVMGQTNAKDPAKLATPPFAKLDRDGAQLAIEDLRQILERAESLGGGDLSAAREVLELLRRCLTELMPK